ncbi:hypothetical protein FKM82_029999 [Ascaphus truei]
MLSVLAVCAPESSPLLLAVPPAVACDVTSGSRVTASDGKGWQPAMLRGLRDRPSFRRLLLEAAAANSLALRVSLWYTAWSGAIND